MPLMVPAGPLRTVTEILGPLDIGLIVSDDETPTAALVLVETVDSAGEVRVRVGASAGLRWPGQLGLLHAAGRDIRP